MINKLKSRFGKRCSGIKINPPELGRVNVAEKQMKFCEAVYYSFKVPVQIDKNNIYCAGAKRNLGYGGNDDSLAKKIAGNNNIPLNFILSALQNIPALKKNEYKIVLGITEEMEKFVQPDVFIIYAKPASIMQIIHDYARKEIKADISPYSLLSICGNVFIKSYMEGNINISFGCPESREFGGVDNEEVIIGVPYKMALLIISENKANDNKIQ